MKRNNKKLLTIMLAGMLCAATAGTVAAIAPVDASATTAKTYALTSIFSSGSETSVVNVVKAEGDQTKFVLSGGDSVTYNRNLAIEWFEAEGEAKYTNIGFKFEDTNFQSVTFTFNSLPMHATKDEVSVNALKFINDDGAIKVKVIADGEDEKDVEAEDIVIVKNSEVVLSLGASDEIGNYSVSLNNKKLDREFTNIGAKYFRTSTDSDDKMNSLEVSAECEETKTTKVVLNAINGQSFALTNDKITDNAKPVMVVNEDVNEFLLGTRFQLDYNFIDVLADSIATTNASYYYQYNPNDEDNGTVTPDYSSLLEIKKNGTYFMETVYEKEDGTKTTVYKENNGEEYVSIKFNPKDGTFIDSEGEFEKAEYMLSWYANTTKDINGVDYLVFNRNQTGPSYIEYPDMNAEVKKYNEALAKKAAGVSGGSNAEIDLPSLAWLIEDANNGYNSLKFTISYKTHASSSPTLISDKSASELKIDAETPGEYQFRIFATDAAGNAMYAKDDEGVDVKVTSSNVWDLDIPTFSYTIVAKGLKTADNADATTSDTKNIGETYTMSDVEIVGVTASKGSSYNLYKLDFSKYTGQGTITSSELTQIKFETLKKNAEAIVSEMLKDITADKIDYVEVNKLAYAQALASRIGGDADKLAKEIFVAIDEYNADIPEDTEDWDNSDNEFEWKPASRSFKTVEDGMYLILADYWDTEMEYVDHVPAYRLIEVISPKDVIKGETEWLKNNLISVILFSVAALMLILIIILLLVKPSDETLEDVDEKVIAKRKQATDKNKKK